MNCQFCSNLMDMFRRISGNASHTHNLPVELGKLSDITGMPCPHADSIRRLCERGIFLNGERNEDLKQFLPKDWTVSTHGRSLYFALDGICKEPFKIRLVARPDKPGHPGTSRVLSPQWTKLSIPRAWYEKCLKEHGHECHKPTWMRLRPERIAMPEWLVDVVDNCVVPCNSNTARYIALSYTWGNVPCLKHTSENIEQLKKIGSLHPNQSRDIPRTVRHAFAITKLLGERYLWVDSLCIAQGEAAASKDLNSMHHIYANSIICLIALAGTNANHGLRGIQEIPDSDPRHVEQIVFDMAGGERFSWLVEAYRQLKDDKRRCNHNSCAVEGSRYLERGWTYQEYVFAKRRLIFTDGLLRWICGCATWGEESYVDLGVPGAWDVPGIWTGWMTSLRPDLGLIQEATVDFNNRSFTHEEDALRAFLGIQNHISRHFLGGLNYGHPEMFFDISLLWSGGLEGTWVSKRRLRGTTSSDVPSWSWMGWQGEFYFETDHEFLPGDSSGHKVGFTESVAQWYTMLSPFAPASDMRPVKCRWQICRGAVENGSIHVPCGWQKVAKSQDRSEHYYRRLPGCEHTNDPSHLTSDHEKFRYPVPLPSSTVATRPIEQRPFIFARTTRSFFVTKRLVRSDLDPDWWYKFEHPLGLFCRDGKYAGFLRLNSERVAPCSLVELVAVVKGWSTSLSYYFPNSHGREEAVSTQWPMGSDSQIDFRRFMRLSCYFVLCVEWENGVAKRQGTGVVEADIWERNRELVDLILG